MNKFLVITILLLSTTYCLADNLPLAPNPSLTPGAINSAATKEVVCVKGYTEGTDANGKKVRDVSESTKKQVLAEYGLTGKESHFEIDHLISLELGGSNDIKNLWPQSYDTKPLNAHVKDALEDRLHALVCSGKLDLGTAQHDISTDWIAAYKKYVGPLPN